MEHDKKSKAPEELGNSTPKISLTKPSEADNARKDRLKQQLVKLVGQMK